MQNKIYLDNAATTIIDPRVLEETLPYLQKGYGNSSSIHSKGRDTEFSVSYSRDRFAKVLKVSSKDIYFTSGGTESNNWAIKGYALANQTKGNHIITSSIEHHSILHSCEWLERLGFRVTYLPVNQEGEVSPKDLEEAICEDTILISIMYANNEIGTKQPIEEIGQIANKHKIAFHVDAVQCTYPKGLNISKSKIDMLSLSSHKFYGPKGCGILYVKSNTPIIELLSGGGQESGLRAGTLNHPNIIGAGYAVEFTTTKNYAAQLGDIKGLSNYFIDRVLEEIPCASLNGSRTNRLGNNVSFTFQGIEGESLLFNLDTHGICCSSGSACVSDTTEMSHVIKAIGQTDPNNGVIRFTLGKYNTRDEIDYTIETLKKIINNF